MKTTLATLILVLLVTGLFSQIFEIEGKAKIMVMDTATASAQRLAREPDGTLSLMVEEITTYAIGDYAQGGVVFWVNPSREHGKVVSIYDIGATTWSNIQSDSIGVTAQSDINGAGNTVAIIMQSGHTSSAARHCADLAYGGYDDWYLPSKDELDQVYQKKDSINTTATVNGGENFTTEWYWSSTEIDNDQVSVVTFTNGAGGGAFKSDERQVRAIRAF